MEDPGRTHLREPDDDVCVAEHVRQSRSTGRVPLVVIADDDSAILELLTDVFSDEGFQVCPCASSQAASVALASTPPDLFITDVLLRGDAPLGPLRKLVENGGAVPPVIVLTGIPDQARHTHAALLEQVAAHVESKPFDLDHLLELVHTLIGWPEHR